MPVNMSPVVPTTSKLRPLGLKDVRISEGFWGERQQLNHDHILDHIESHLESEGWLPNFDLTAAGDVAGHHRGRDFADSEIYKYLEALAWEIGRTSDPELEDRFRVIVARVTAAQDEDGYLHTAFGHHGQQPRWSDLERGHELYCLGHLFQAAVARHRTRPTSDDGLVDAARRAADLVCEVFADGANESICGHAEVEVGLIELGRALEDKRYVAMGRTFIDRHGHAPLKDIGYGQEFWQNDVPVREATAHRGHAVRANYLAAGAVDAATETGDDELLESLRRQWSNTVGARTYLTGGQGSRHHDESFGVDYELPADRAYSETCAGVGSIMFSWRLLLADGNEKYADLIERTLFNVIATSPRRDGKAFFYANTLHQRVPGIEADTEETSVRSSSDLRAEWFEVSCCPPNVARTLASLGSYLATRDDDGLQLHQYAPASIDTTLPDERRVSLDVDTDYPLTGTIHILVKEDSGSAWTLGLRVPAWAEGATLTSPDGDTEPAAPGHVQLRRHFRSGDVVTLELPVAPRITAPDRRIDAIRGTVAVERGPVVLALESPTSGADNVPDLDTVIVDASAGTQERDGRVWVRLTAGTEPTPEWPYGEPDSAPGDSVEVPLTPYHDWGNRGPATMRVWLPTR